MITQQTIHDLASVVRADVQPTKARARPIKHQKYLPVIGLMPLMSCCSRTSSLITLAKTLCEHLQSLRCKGSGILLLVDTVTNTREDAAKVS